MTAKKVPKVPEVVITYTHCVQGRLMERALHRLLAEAGHDVVSDRDMANPPSIQRWMVEMITSRIILCVLTLDYIRAFGGEGGDNWARLGVQYEATLVRQRIYYNHSRFDICPVIPVAAPGFDVNLCPLDLRALDVQRFDPNTGAGAERLLARIQKITVGAEGTMML